MSSGPSPSVTFKNFVELTPQGNGTLRVGNVVNGVNATVSDGQSDGSSDSTAILGDISNERMFVVDASGRTSQPDMTYWGKSPDQQGVIGRIPSSKTATGFNYLMYTNNSYTAFSVIPDSNFSQTSFALCFVSGTRILTARGEVAVEDLRAGDVVVTASGRHRPITWIGHRHVGGGDQALALDRQPVRVREGAFGPGRPARDLALSPGHPVLVGADADGEGGVLVPVMCLINGTTIAREVREQVTYWHVELDAHDILLAEGLPAESFLDLGCRAFFAEGSDHVLHDPDFVPPGLSGRCRPVAVDGPLVEAERNRLDAVFARALADDCAWVDAGRFDLTAA